MSEQTKPKDKKSKVIQVRVRVPEKLYNLVYDKAKESQMSVNSYINFVLNSEIQNQEVIFDEKINKYEKKEVERVLLQIGN